MADGQKLVRVEVHIDASGGKRYLLLNCANNQSKRVWEIKNELMRLTELPTEEQILILPVQEGVEEQEDMEEQEDVGEEEQEYGIVLSDPFYEVKGLEQPSLTAVYLYRRMVVPRLKEIQVRVFIDKTDAPITFSSWPNVYTTLDGICSDTTVLELKQAIDEKHGIPPGRQILHARFPPLSVELLDDNCRLENTLPMFGTFNSDTMFKLRLTEIPREKNDSAKVKVKIVRYRDDCEVQGMCKRMTGKKGTLKIDVDVDTVFTLRAEITRILDELGSADRYNGYILRNKEGRRLGDEDGDLNLRECGIEANDTITADFDSNRRTYDIEPEDCSDDDFEGDDNLYS